MKRYIEALNSENKALRLPLFAEIIGG